jgi:hypothetical protein
MLKLKSIQVAVVLTDQQEWRERNLLCVCVSFVCGSCLLIAKFQAPVKSIRHELCNLVLGMCEEGGVGIFAASQCLAASHLPSGPLLPLQHSHLLMALPPQLCISGRQYPGRHEKG